MHDIRGKPLQLGLGLKYSFYNVDTDIYFNVLFVADELSVDK